MKIERFEVPGLAQYSYVLAHEGEAVVVDPMRDTDGYVAYARLHDLTITHVLETHIHADYASGATALAAETGAELWLSAHDTGEDFEYQFAHHAFGDGEVLELGTMRIRAVHTPGHTPEHLSLLVFDWKRSREVPVAMLSGDFLFVGSLGRPDLLGEGAKERLAEALYDSVHRVLADLPDGLEVLPGHGAGSLCGAGMGEMAQTTLGYERVANGFFRLESDAFVEEILRTVPPFPGYYRRMKLMNAQGAALLNGVPGGTGISAKALRDMMTGEDLILLDVRRPEAFGGAHIEGAINIGAGQNLSLWAGWMLDAAKRIVLVGETGDDERSRRSLIRVGLDGIAGYLEGGMAAWVEAGFGSAAIPQISVSELQRRKGEGMVLDVRSDGEWKTGHIAGAWHVMLGDLPERMAELPMGQRIFAVCGSGYRSSLAASLLQRHGFGDVVNMSGGMGAWGRQRLPLV